MFIEQGIKSENKFWKYIVGSLVIIFASFLGQIPLLLALLYETFLNGKKFLPRGVFYVFKNEIYEILEKYTSPAVL